MATPLNFDILQQATPEEMEKFRSGLLSYSQLADLVSKRTQAAPSEPVVVEEVPAELPDRTWGEAVDDEALALRSGSRIAVGGAVGLPVNIANLATDPLPARVARAAIDKLFGTDIETPMESLGGPAAFSQPEFVEGIRESLAIDNQRDFEENASDKRKAQRAGYEGTEGFIDTLLYLKDNPAYAASMGLEQVPQLLMSVPGSRVATIAAQGGLAGSQVESQVADALREEVKAGRMTEEQAAEIASNVFAASAGINTALPFGPGGDVIERAIAREAAKKFQGGAAANILKATAGEAAQGAAGESSDAIAENLGVGRPWQQGVGKAAATGAILEGGIGGTVAAGQTGELRTADRVDKVAKLVEAQVMSTQDRIRKAAELSGASPDTVAAAEAGVAASAALQLDLALEGGEGTAPTPLPSPEPVQDVVEGSNRRAQQEVETLREVAALKEREAQTAQARVDEVAQTNAQLEGTGYELPLPAEDVVTAQVNAEAAAAAREAADKLALAEGARQGDLPLARPEQPKTKKFEEVKTKGGEVLVRDTETGTVTPKNDQRIMEARQRGELQAQSEFSKKQKAYEKARKAQETKLVNLAAETGRDSAWVREGMNRWSAMNKPPSMEQITAERKAKAEEAAAKLDQKAQPATKKAGKKKGAAEKTINAEDLGKVLGLESVAEGETVDVAPEVQNKVRKFSENVVRSLGIKNTDALIKGLKANNVNIVKSVDQLPAKVSSSKVDGMYHNGKVYLVLDNLNANTDVPTLLHEVVHKARDAADVKYSKSTAQMMGKENGQRIVQKMEKLAGSNRIAAEAVKRATEARKNAPESAKGTVYTEEMIAYAITAAERARKNRGAIGSMVGVVKDILNAANIYMADVLGTEVTITPETLAAMNRKDFGKTLESKKTQSGEARESVIGPNSTRFVEEALERTEDVYQDPLGNRKIEISDSKARIKSDALDRLKWEGSITVDNYMRYPELLDGYDVPIEQTLTGVDMGNGITDDITLEFKPLRKVRIKLSDSLKTSGAYDPFEDAIYISPSAITNPTDARQWIFHELQHAIQVREGWIGGADFVKFLQEEAAKEGVEVETYETPDGGTRARYTKIDENSDFDPDTDGMDIYWRAWDRYDRNYGEAEARLAETNYLMSPEEMRERLPEERMTRRNEGTPIKREELILESVAVDDDAETRSDAAARILKTIFNPTGNLGMELFEIRDFARNITAARSATAETLQKQYKASIKKAAKNSDMSEQEFMDVLEKEIDAIDAIDDRDKRSNAMDLLEAKYPGVGASLRQLRDFKWDMTREIINLRKQVGDKIPESQIALYQKMVSNAERYNTRAYLATLGGPDQSKAYGRQFLKRAKKDPDSAEGRKLSAAVEWLMNNELLIPDRSTLETKTRPQLERMYSVWIGQPPQGKAKKAKARMIEELSQRENATRDVVESKALEIIREMLGQTKQLGPTASYYRGGKINNTILMRKTNMPKELREVMGEVTDPFLRESITLARMSQLIGHLILPTEINNKGQGRWVSETKEGDFQYKLTGPAYGALDGKYVTRPVYDAMTDVMNFYAQFDEALATAAHDSTALAKFAAGKAAPVFGRITALQKKADIVGNVSFYFLNLSGALGIMAPMNGISPIGKTAFKGLASSMKTVVATTGRNPEDIPIVEELLEAGVLDSATVGEFSSQVYRDIFEKIDKLNSEDSLFAVKVGKAIWEAVSQGKRFDRSRPAEFMTELYAATDVWVKASTYFDRKDFYQKFNEAEGITMSESELRRRAGIEASATNISYKLALPAARMLERNVPGTMFLTYFSETFRSTMMSYVQAYRDYGMAADAKTAKGKALAMGLATRRLIGTTAMIAGWTAALNALLDNEDEEEKKKRDLRAEYLKNSFLLPIGFSENGSTVSLPVERVHPVGNVPEFLVDVLRAEDKPEEVMEYISGLFVRNRQFNTFLQMVTDVAAEGGIGTDKRAPKSNIATKYPEAYDAMKEYLSFGDLGENLTAFIEGFLPASARPLLEPEERVAKYDEGLVSQYLAQPLVEMGWKPVNDDPDTALEFRARDYNNALGEVRNEWNDFLTTPRAKNPEKVATKMTELISEEQEAFRKLHAAYEGYLAYYGKDPRQAIATLTAPNVRVPKETAAAVRYGRFRSSVISADAVNDWYKRELKTLDREDSDYREQVELLKLQRRTLLEAAKRTK